jgi:hypothetical protein
LQLSPAPAYAKYPHNKLRNHHKRLCQGGEHSVVGSLGVEVAVEQQGVALGPPGVVVTNTPKGDTDAVLLVQASLDNVGPVGLLGVLDVELGDGALWGSSAESSHGSRGLGTLSGDKMGLGANAINGKTSSPPLLDVLDQALGLAVRGRVQVVVVDVQLGVGVGLAGSLECDPDKVLSKDVVVHTGTEATVLLEHLVDDVPGVNLALVAAHQCVDVVLHHRGQCGLVTNLRNPAGKLRVPDEGVSTDELLVGSGEAGYRIGVCEVELAARALSSIELPAWDVLVLHTTENDAFFRLPVLCGDLSEVCLDDGSVLSSVESVGVSGGTEVLPALLDHGSVNALGSLALIKLDGFRRGDGRRDCRTGQKSGDDGELHNE